MVPAVNQTCSPSCDSSKAILSKCQKSVHPKPVTFARFNARRGKPKGATIKALLDSGRAESLMIEICAEKLKMRKTAGSPKKWSAPAGDETTSHKCETQFTFPEPHSDQKVEWDSHVTKDLGARGMIIGCDILKFLRINIKFSDQTIEWDFQSVPFKDQESNLTNFFVEEPKAVECANERLRKILDAKCEKADPQKICCEQPELSTTEQDQLL